MKMEDDPLYHELVREQMHLKPSQSVERSNWFAKQKWEFFRGPDGSARVAKLIVEGCLDEAAARKRAYAQWHIDNNVCF